MLEVFVVDDDDALLLMLQRGLETYGLIVRTANGGAAAIQIFAKHRGSIGLVLLGLNMDGRDGPATLEELRKLAPSIPALYMASPSCDFHRAGDVRVLEKPFPSLEDVATIIRSQLLVPNRVPMSSASDLKR